MYTSENSFTRKEGAISHFRSQWIIRNFSMRFRMESVHRNPGFLARLMIGRAVNRQFNSCPRHRWPRDRIKASNLSFGRSVDCGRKS